MLVRLRSSIGSPTAMNVNFQKQASWGTWLNKCLLLGDTELRQLDQALTLPWKLTWEALFIRGFQGVFRICVTEHHDSFHFLSQQPVFRNLSPLWDLHSFVYEVFTKGLKFIVLQKWVDSSQKWVSSVSAWSASPRRRKEPQSSEALDLRLLLLPGLDGVEEPHGVEQTHRHVAAFLLLTIHLKKEIFQKYVV